MSEEVTKPTKVFNWNDAESGKEEFDEMWDSYVNHLRGKAYLLSPLSVTFATPRDPGPRPAAGAALSEWNKRMDVYQDKMLKLHADSLAALGTLRACFSYSCTAHSDIESAVVQPPDVEEALWTPIQQLPAAIARLRAVYMPTTVPDIVTLRLELQKLSDESSGGFSNYRALFTQKLSILKKTNIPDVVTASELRQWVISGIKNAVVFSTVVSKYVMEHDQCTHEEIFDHVSSWMTLNKNNGIDPYQTITIAPGTTSITIAAAILASRTAGGNQILTGGQGGKPLKCLRCWTLGHTIKECHAAICGVCKRPLQAAEKTCSNWANHPEEQDRFYGNKMPRWMENNNNNNNNQHRNNNNNNNSKNSHGSSNKRKSDNNDDRGNSKKDKKKLKLKAMRADAKAFKKLKFNSENRVEELN